jgi:hypothetical protein
MGEYEMYSEEGSETCRKMVESLGDRMRKGLVTRTMLDDVLQGVIQAIANKFPEVTDTEPRMQIRDKVNEICDELGWRKLTHV